MNTLEIVLKGAIDVLLDNDDLTDIVEDRFYNNAAPPKLADTLPYVQITNTGGGNLNDAPYDASDIELMIVAVTRDQPTAKSIASLIREALHRQKITFDEGWVSSSSVRETGVFSRQITVQNTQYHMFGAYYRFRLVHDVE